MDQEDAKKTLYSLKQGSLRKGEETIMGLLNRNKKEKPQQQEPSEQTFMMFSRETDMETIMSAFADSFEIQHPAGWEEGIIHERHMTLNWMIRFMDAEWDDVDTPA